MSLAQSAPAFRYPTFAAGVAVACGASVGAVCRYLITELSSSTLTSITVINILGCALLGIIAARCGTRPLLKAFAGTGFCGGFTTFSAFILVTLSEASISIATGVFITVVHLVCCPLAYAAGEFAVRRLRREAKS